MQILHTGRDGPGRAGPGQASPAAKILLAVISEKLFATISEKLLATIFEKLLAGPEKHALLFNSFNRSAERWRRPS